MRTRIKSQCYLVPSSIQWKKKKRNVFNFKRKLNVWIHYDNDAIKSKSLIKTSWKCVVVARVESSFVDTGDWHLRWTRAGPANFHYYCLCVCLPSALSRSQFLWIFFGFGIYLLSSFYQSVNCIYRFNSTMAAISIKTIKAHNLEMASPLVFFIASVFTILCHNALSVWPHIKTHSRAARASYSFFLEDCCCYCVNMCNCFFSMLRVYFFSASNFCSIIYLRIYPTFKPNLVSGRVTNAVFTVFNSNQKV